MGLFLPTMPLVGVDISILTCHGVIVYLMQAGGIPERVMDVLTPELHLKKTFSCYDDNAR